MARDKDIGNKVETAIVDSILSMPQAFEVKGQRFLLYPPTLGVTYLASRLLTELDINLTLLKVNPALEVIRLLKEHRSVLCTLIAYLTTHGKEEASNGSLIGERASLFGKVDDESLASLVMYYLQQDQTEEIIKGSGIGRDLKNRQKVNAVKKDNDKNSYTFGGLTPYGITIDWFAERYGWTKDYIIWGIDYASLKLLQLDAPTTVFVTDDERKHIHISNDRHIVNGDDAVAVNEFINQQSWN